MLIKDLKFIKAESEKNLNKNYRFRSFLKGQDGHKVDLLVKPIYEYVRNNIDCTECGNCCNSMYPELLSKDLNLLEKELGIERKEILEKYTEKTEDNDLILKGNPCPFLKDKKCSIYENRPEDCRSFPHLHKKHFTTRLIGVIQNMSVCPIVFNVVEILKSKMHFR